MTTEELVAALRPVRLPADFAVFGWTDVLAAASLGVLATMLLWLLARPLLARRADPAWEAEAEIARLSQEPPRLRIYGLAKLAQRLQAPLPEPARLALYDPAAEIDPAALETLIRQAARKARR